MRWLAASPRPALAAGLAAIASACAPGMSLPALTPPQQSAPTPQAAQPTGSITAPTAVHALRPGTLRQTAALSTTDLEARLDEFEEGRWTRRLAGPPTCAVDIYRYEYDTIGARGEAATASGALMVPRGRPERCSGPRPTVVALHGTVPYRGYDHADLGQSNPATPRSLAWAGVYASQGYVVVAPNYIGLDSSSTDYQAYHVASQQPQEVIDALSAAREVLSVVRVESSPALFLVGYSQGGWVAMATHREMEARGMAVTASVPMSGVYALSAMVDDVFQGRPVRGSTIYFTLAIRGWQEAYGDLYEDPAEIFNPALLPDITTLLPSATPVHQLMETGRLPASALFSEAVDVPGATEGGAVRDDVPASGTAQFAAIYRTGFGPVSLLNDAFRRRYLADMAANPDRGAAGPPVTSDVGLRRAAIRNDLRNWTPTGPVMMCGGPDDGAAPFRLGARMMMEYWSQPRSAPKPGIVSLLDFGQPTHEGDLFAELRRNLAEERITIETGQPWPVWVDAYHQILLPRYCYLAARQFFDTLQ